MTMETPNCYFYYLLGEDQQQIEIKYNQFCINEFQQNKRYFRVIKKRIHKINTVKLMSLLVELNNSMEMGMTLNQAISSIASSGDKQLSCLCLYISQQINSGVSVHQSVSNICDKATRFLCEFLPENTTQEGFKKSLAIIIQYLKSRKEVSDKLVKSLYYPYFIAQSSSIIMIINAIMKDAFELSLLAIYGLTCGVQAVILYLVISGKVIFFLEQFFSSLRLYNFFELLLASIDSGESLQNSIKKIALSSSHHLNKKQLYILYYKIRLGFDYSDSFPQNWFLKESRLALVNSNKNGSIDRALSMASELQKQRWTKTLNTLNNIIPVASLLIAGLFVAQLLISIYAPLMEPF